MWEILGQAFLWLLLIFFGGQAFIFIGLVLWTIWADAIKPRLIPDAEIVRIAEGIIGNFPDPEQEVFLRQQAAWHRCDGAGQVYWKRVRKAVRKLEG